MYAAALNMFAGNAGDDTIKGGAGIDTIFINKNAGSGFLLDRRFLCLILQPLVILPGKPHGFSGFSAGTRLCLPG